MIVAKHNKFLVLSVLLYTLYCILSVWACGKLKKCKKMLKNVLKINGKNGNLNTRKHYNGIINVSEKILTDDGLLLHISINEGDCFYSTDAIVKILKSSTCVEEKGKKMLNIQQTAKYMVQYYYYTGQRFSCTNAKIEKLLSISSLIAMRFNKRLFAEPICNKSCGVGYPQIGEVLLSDLTDGTETLEKRIDLEINKNLFCAPYYIVDINLNKYEEVLLTDVFLEFGAYDSKELGHKIDDFKNEIMTYDSPYRQVIDDVDRIRNFFSDENKKVLYKDNIVFTYISTYQMESE